MGEVAKPGQPRREIVIEPISVPEPISTPAPSEPAETPEYEPA